MIQRVARQAVQLAKDPELKPYWIARGVVASLFFLFGILLRESGYSPHEVIGAWIAVYIAQAALLLTLDKAAKHWSGNIHGSLVLITAVGSLVGMAIMALVGVKLIWFSAATILLLPVLRESIHNGTLYIRDQRWEFGVNLASLCANEMGKGFGAFFIFLIGYMSSIDERLMAGLIVVLVILCVRNHWNQKRSGKDNAFDPNLDIGPLGRGYVKVSTIHNGAFTAIKAVLSLLVFEILTTKADIDSIITSLATAVSICLLIGMALVQILQNKAEKILRAVYRSSLFSISLAILMFLSISALTIVSLFLAGTINADLASYGLATVIALIMAAGSLFTLGTLQYLDKAFGLNKDSGADFRKATMHHAWIGASFAPSVFLGGYLIALMFTNALNAGVMCLVAICMAEVYVTCKSIQLNREAGNQKISITRSLTRGADQTS